MFAETSPDAWAQATFVVASLVIATVVNWLSSHGVRRELREHMTEERALVVAESAMREQRQEIQDRRWETVNEQLAIGTGRMASLESVQAQQGIALGEVKEAQSTMARRFDAWLHDGRPETREGS